jgi:hypothetical protein
MANTQDIYFDINIRDVVMQGGDIALIQNSSVQNGSVLKEAHCFSPKNPIWGIGLESTLNAPVQKANYEMGRWADQAKKDGAKKAKYTVINKDNITDITIDIAY